MKKPNVIPASIAAKEKGCTVEGIYYAVNTGSLNATKMGAHWLVYRDKVYASWQPRLTGGRAHKSYRTKQRK